MPYKSQAQARMMHAQMPAMAARWDEEMPPGMMKRLPKYKGKKRLPKYKGKKARRRG